MILKPIVGPASFRAFESSIVTLSNKKSDKKKKKGFKSYKKNLLKIETMKTMISDLPRDLVEEIISRLPLKSLRRVRLTCRKWNNLSKSRSFTKMHISNEAASARKTGELMIIVLMDYNLYLMSIVADVGPSLESKGKLCCLEEQVKISQVYHCEGLLLCILEEDDTKVVVWNPYTGQTRWIETPYSHHPSGVKVSYALGYEDKKSCRSYKFFRFIDYYLHPTGDLFTEIYDLDSSLWKTHDVTPRWLMLFGLSGVSLKGNTYFCASKLTSEGELNDYIICFDFTKERFGPLLPLPISVGVDDYVNLSCVREEKLAVFGHYDVNPYEIEIWFTTKIDAENVSWSKFLTVDTKPNLPISHQQGFFSHEEKKLVMVFDEDKRITFQIIGEAGYFRELDLRQREEKMCEAPVSSYIPSLVQIKQLSGGKRKQQPT